MSVLNNSTVTLRAINALYKMTKSRRATGALVGVSGSTVTNLLRKAGKSIQQPGGQNQQLSPDNLVAAYWQREESLRDIAARADVSPSTVLNTMRRFGIPTRSV